MKRVKIIVLLVVLTAAMIMLPVPAALAGHGHTSVSIGVGLGYGYHGGYYHGYGYRGWPGYYHHYYPYPVYGYPYYAPPVVVAAPPVVVAQPPVVVAQPPVIVQAPAVVQPAYPAEETGMQQLRDRKAQLLAGLNNGQRPEQIQAVIELSGYTYDESVRSALENALLSSQDPSLRKEAANSLGKGRNPASLGALEKARIADEDVNVRTAADAAIRMIKP